MSHNYPSPKTDFISLEMTRTLKTLQKGLHQDNKHVGPEYHFEWAQACAASRFTSEVSEVLVQHQQVIALWKA